MKERPILFSGPMVRAILAGRKTQTRRLWKQRPCDGPDGLGALPSPYGSPGDRLWVRESFAYCDDLADGSPPEDPTHVAYMVDREARAWGGGPGGKLSAPLDTYAWNWSHPSIRWRPSIHMPRWASRLTLDVIAVRVERLQAIAAADAVDEGAAEILDPGHPLRAKCYERFGTWTGDPAKDVDGPFAGAVDAYATLWDDINGDRAPWASNPWVWVVEFRQVQP